MWMRLLVALKVGEQIDDVGLILRRSGRALRIALEQERLADVGVEQVFCGGEASGVFDRVGEAGNMEDNGVCGFFGAEAFTGFKAALTEGAREAQDSGNRLNVLLLLVGER